MADNVAITAGSGTNVAADEATYSGDTVKVQIVRLVHVAGAEGSKTVSEIMGTAGSPGTAVVTVQGVASGTVIPISDGAGSITVDNGGTFAVQAASAGVAAHDAAVSGNPVLAGGYASAAAPTDVSADGDVVRAWRLRSGAAAVQPTFAGVLAVAGNGASGTGVQRVTIANDSTGILAAVTNVATIGTSVTPGTSAAHLGKAEDAAHSSGDTGVAMLAVRRDTAATSVSANGDYETLSTTATGSLRVALAEDAAGDSYLTSAVQAVADLTSGADLSVLSAAGSGIRNYVTDLDVVNTSGTATRVDLYSGDPDSAGVLIASVPVGPNGAVKTFTTPRKGAANTAIFAQSTAGDCTVSVGGFTSVAG